MEKELAVDQYPQQAGLRDAEHGMDPESSQQPSVEIEKIEQVYRKLDWRIIPGTPAAQLQLTSPDQI